MRRVVANEVASPCFAERPTHVVVDPRPIITALQKEHLQLQRVARKRGRRVAWLVLAASRKDKRGEQCWDEARARAADEDWRSHVRSRRS
jgi:hypothetical protein